MDLIHNYIIDQQIRRIERETEQNGFNSHLMSIIRLHRWDQQHSKSRRWNRRRN